METIDSTQSGTIDKPALQLKQDGRNALWGKSLIGILAVLSVALLVYNFLIYQNLDSRENAVSFRETNLNDLQNQESQLRVKNRSLEDLRKNLSASVSELQAQEASLKNDIPILLARQGEYKALTERVSETQEILDERLNQKAELESEERKIQENTLRLNSSIAGLRNQESNLKVQVTQLEGEVTQKEAEIEARQRQFNRLQENHRNLTVEERSLRENASSLKSQNDRVSELKTAETKLRSDIKLLEAEERVYNGLISTLKSQHDALKRQLSEREEEIDRMQKTQTKLRGDELQLRENIGSLTAQNTRVAELKEEERDIQTNLDSLKSEQNIQRRRNSELRVQIDEKEAELADRQKSLTQVEAKITDRQKSLTQVDARLRTSTDRLVTDIETLENTVNQLQNDITSLATQEEALRNGQVQQQQEIESTTNPTP